MGGALSGEPVVETARLIGRRPSLEHLGAFAAIMADPLVAQAMWPGDLAWVVRPDRWGRGYAAELAAPARELLFSRGMHSVVAMTLVTNTASRRLMEKLELDYEREIDHVGLPHVLYRGRQL